MYQLTISDVTMLLSYNDNFLILTHKKPDGDTIGSAGALCLGLRSKGKTAYLQNSGEVTPRYEKYFNTLVASEDFKPNFIISCDIADTQLVPDSAKQYEKNIDLSIDHHPTNKMFAGHNFVDASASATGEIINDVLRGIKVEMTKEIMTYLYLAVSTDTGCFKYSNTTAKAHIIAADAIVSGMDFGTINREFFETKTLGRFNIERHLFDALIFEGDGKIAIANISRKDIDTCEATEDDIDNISALSRQIQGVECAITVIEQKNGTLKASVRAQEPLDASKVCEVFGGGGHARAAGCVVTEETLKQLINEVKERIFNV